MILLVSGVSARTDIASLKKEFDLAETYLAHFLVRPRTFDKFREGIDVNLADYIV